MTDSLDPKATTDEMIAERPETSGTGSGSHQGEPDREESVPVAGNELSAEADEEAPAGMAPAAMTAAELTGDQRQEEAASEEGHSQELLSALEAIIYAAEEPATLAQISAVLGISKSEAESAVEILQQRFAGDQHGIEVKAVAGGYRMASKPQHHEAVRKFIKSLKPPVKLSLPALETLAVIAYRQPITVPEIKEIRGVDPGGVINTLLEKKLITTSGRKEVVGKPILYKTTRDFLIRFGLHGIGELPTLKEFEEMTRAGLEGVELESGETAPLLAGAEEVPEPPSRTAESSGEPASANEPVQVQESQPAEQAPDPEASTLPASEDVEGEEEGPSD